MDVGTGTLPRYGADEAGPREAFQVPSLIGISTHAPFLHNGCAPTLRDRFGPCGGNRHGDTSQLSPDELNDLVAYLETL
jgi:cytochrome c peroxidase